MKRLQKTGPTSRRTHPRPALSRGRGSVSGAESTSGTRPPAACPSRPAPRAGGGGPNGKREDSGGCDPEVSTGTLKQQRSHGPRPCEERLLYRVPPPPAEGDTEAARCRARLCHTAGWRGKQWPVAGDDQGACDCVLPPPWILPDCQGTREAPTGERTGDAVGLGPATLSGQVVNKSLTRAKRSSQGPAAPGGRARWGRGSGRVSCGRSL